MTKLGQKRTVPKKNMKRTGGVKSPKIKQLDTLWSKIIKLRAGNVCEMCGQTSKARGMQAAHYIGRVFHSTRWELDNGACLDTGCHIDIDNDSKLKEDFFRKKMGSQRQDELRTIAYTRIKPDKEKILEELKAKLEALVDTGEDIATHCTK